jgi:hypothetical protein
MPPEGQNMIRLGRVLSVLGILSFAFLLSLSSTSVRAAVDNAGAGHWAASIVGGIGGPCVFTAWGLALYHWGTRYQGSLESRRRWGIGLILGAFLGAWAYWLRPSMRAHR